jgi:hypothetical protein
MKTCSMSVTNDMKHSPARDSWLPAPGSRPLCLDNELFLLILDIVR